MCWRTMRSVVPGLKKMESGLSNGGNTMIREQAERTVVPQVTQVVCVDMYRMGGDTVCCYRAVSGKLKLVPLYYF